MVTYNRLDISISLFNNLGMSNIYTSKQFQTIKILLENIKRRQFDQYLQTWNNNIEASFAGKTWFLKQVLNLEQYFIKLPEKIMTNFLKFRTCNHFLPIDSGCWNNAPIENRLCTQCQENNIWNEYHYFFKCNYFTDKCKMFIKPYFYTKKISTLKIKELFICHNISTLRRISKFISEITSKLCKP